MPRPRQYEPDLRDRLVDVAGRLLAEEGPQALTTRRITATAGTTTNALYTLIGGKAELVGAMYLAGFRRLAARMDAVAENLPPLERLEQLGAAYLDNAFANPHLYTVMFERPIAGFVPTDADLTEALGTLQRLIDQVTLCIDAGALPPSPTAHDQAMSLWAVSHGVCSLTIAGMFEPEEARDLCARASTALGLGFSVGAR